MSALQQTDEMKQITENNPRVTILAGFPEQFSGSSKIYGYVIDENPDTLTIRQTADNPTFTDSPVLQDGELELIKNNIGGIRRHN